MLWSMFTTFKRIIGCLYHSIINSIDQSPRPSLSPKHSFQKLLYQKLCKSLQKFLEAMENCQKSIPIVSTTTSTFLNK